MYQLALPLKKPTAQSRWEGVEFGEHWANVYRMSFEITSSTILQTLRYRIVHRYFPTRRYFYSRKVVDGPVCDDYDQVDSLYHHFFRMSRGLLFLDGANLPD